MNILQVSAEYHPLLKTGGLADVTGALPAALNANGCDVRVLLPGFPAILAGLQEPTELLRFHTHGGAELRLLRGTLLGTTTVQAYVLDAPGLLDRPGNPYEDAHKQPYADNHRRFAALAWGAVQIAQGGDTSWKPQLVHGHDWHAGLVPACLLHAGGGQPLLPSVFTVHNLAYQGLFDVARFPDLGLPWSFYQVEGLEFWGQISFLKAGLHYANRITTVSPTYAREIQTPELGCGLDGLLRRRQSDLSGILNGVDGTIWNPTTDPLLPHRFGSNKLLGKARCKAALQIETGLHTHADAPLFTVVSRLTEQKGLPLVLEAVDGLVERGAQLLVLGNGDAHLEAAFLAKAQQHAGRVAVRIGFDEAFSHRVFGGSDVTLVPSRFEPCGLTQLYALAYGSVPLVRRVGGLADSVTDTQPDTLASDTATGIVFNHMDVGEFTHALQRAMALYRHPSQWDRVQRAGMRQHFSWDEAAQQYAALYRSLIPA
ncbi:MAG: glycogen synthase GlgA [Hydrogenophaga sp.]|uniref:glycogen synthase GlgA n=1 Tax=Hydrogenophaga sp. TaxID=1904254 RepID=UPI00277A6A4C|nr:glycogen synthase GlgA [Hydrogenophaga sp.]MDP2417330.1 glycogen synthase GlgA [Hydrogenophaga sp.]MDZ4186960.1 glycogen synthase GlgA [Hydrogenophaga sp.]